MNRTHTKYLQVYHYTAHTVLSVPVPICPAAAAPLPRRLLLSCTCGDGQILSFRSSETEAKIFIETICQIPCSYRKHPGWGNLCFYWLRWDVCRTKVFFKGKLEKTQSCPHSITINLFTIESCHTFIFLSSFWITLERNPKWARELPPRHK